MCTVYRAAPVTAFVSRSAARAGSRVPIAMAAIEKSSPPTAAIPNVSCDSKSLRAYLSRDTHTRVSLLSVEDFTSWCEKETLERLARDRPASLRARVDATKRFYRELLKPLEKNVFSADAAFENGDDSVEILSAKKAVAQARAAIDGITKYLNVEKEERGPETWSTSSSANADASTKSQQQKRLATQTKLAALVEKLPQLEATYETLISRSKTWHAMHDAHEELKKVGVEIGLDIIEGELAAAHRETGNDSSVKGASFESVGLGVIAKLVREGTLRCSPDMHMPEPLIKPKTLLLLNNVHLWMSHGEIDGVLMEVNDLDGAFVDERMGKQSGIKMERLMESNGNNSLDSTPPVTVLAIFECKRNPDDARLGVLKRACDLSWLSGDRKSYRPDAYVNKYYPTGHFTCGVHPISKIEVLNTADEVSKDTLTALLDTKNKSALVLTKASFRLFLDDEEKNKLDRLYAVTRPRTMCGLDIKVRAPLMQRSCARVASFIFDDLGEVLSEGAFATEIEHLRSEDCNGARRVALRNELEKLHAWLHEKCDETNLDDLHDSYGLFSKYLDATENGDDNEQGRVVLVDA